MKNLVIVESPAKAKTIEKFLGGDFVVKSSYGHIRDLVKKDMGIDVAAGFVPAYEVSPDSKRVVAELRKLAKDCEQVWLATDEDREGEAIAWHLAQVLKLDVAHTPRITFNEITKNAIQKAVAQPRRVDVDLVNAQQARRVVDRLVGFELSPILWKKIRYGLSAGRVQSVAVRLIVEREREIDAFDSQMTYRLSGEFVLDEGTLLKAKWAMDLADVATTHALLERMKTLSLSVQKIEEKPAKRSPRAPFTTSTLQQEAANKLGFSVSKTMTLAQRLYEAGRITYMRTDSVNLSNEAMGAMGQEIAKRFGPEAHQARKFKNKNDSAQEAHEAIRPTHFDQEIAGKERDEQRLYQLIWKRTLASQMADAHLLRTTVQISHDALESYFEAKGQVVVTPGFLQVYSDAASGDEDVLLPPVTVGQVLTLHQACARETFTRPPARFNEAALVRELEELGIGRPSTYAPTITTIQDRGYVIKEDREGTPRVYTQVCLQDGVISQTQESEMVGTEKSKLFPTDIAGVVTDFLVKNFPDIVDFQFTAKLEASFDAIASHQQNWSEMVGAFYTPFHAKVESAQDIPREEAGQVRQLGQDPVSGKPVSVRIGRFGPFVQIGTKEDEEKPAFASLMPGQRMDTLSFEQAMELFKLPRLVGHAPESVAFQAIDGTTFAVQKGQEIKANAGRFGPYVQFGPKDYAPIKGFDPLSIELDQAWPLIVEKLQKEAEKLIARHEGGIEILNGRWGPYVTDGERNGRLDKERDPLTYTHQELAELLKSAPAKPKKGRAAVNKTARKAPAAKKTPAKKPAAKTTAKRSVTKPTK